MSATAYAPGKSIFRHHTLNFTIGDALTGVLVMGATGSGKTSGPARLIAEGYLRMQFGGIVLCSKADERERWEDWAANEGRLDDLIIIDGKNEQGCFNFLDWEAERKTTGGGLTINIVALLDELAGAISGGSDSGGNENKFFEDALHHLNMNLVELAGFADLKLSFSLFDEILSTAPRSLAEAKSDEWQQESLCAQALREAEERLAVSRDPLIHLDFEQCRKYWLLDFPTLSEKTRSIITLSFSLLVQPFVTRPLRKLFSTETTVKPEDMFKGKIIIVDLPIQQYRLAGRIANIAWKYCAQIAILRRSDPSQTGEAHHRPVFLWADEAQNFVTEFDAEYQAVARSAGGATVYLTQNRESLRRVLGNDDTVDSLVGNLQSKWFCQNTGSTNEWAAKLLGERWTSITSYGISGESGNTNFADQRRYYFEPASFATLRRGGPHNDFQVETVIFNGGAEFTNDDGDSRPYIVLSLPQK